MRWTMLCFLGMGNGALMPGPHSMPRSAFDRCASTAGRSAPLFATMQLRDAASPAAVSVGERVQVWIDTAEDEEEDSSVWAAAEVRSVDEASGDFMVDVTEWAGLDPGDPEFEEVYEEGPFAADDEGDEWRRPPSSADEAGSAGAEETSVPIPEGAVVFDRAKHEAYDYEAEYAAVEAVVRQLSGLTRAAGMDNDDKDRWAGLGTAVESLFIAMAGSPAPPVVEDPRLIGDWECVGCSSPDAAGRRGLSGLGTAPFTRLAGLFFSISPEGAITAREVLSFWGKEVLLNELRGTVAFSQDGSSIQEKYEEADLAGQQNSNQFSGASAILSECRITADGSMRIGRVSNGVIVLKKLPEGALDAYLSEKRLPTDGGTYMGNPSWVQVLEGDE